MYGQSYITTGRVFILHAPDSCSIPVFLYGPQNPPEVSPEHRILSTIGCSPQKINKK